MRRKDFSELKKKKTPKQIIHLHANNMITLTNKQLDELIEKRLL